MFKSDVKELNPGDKVRVHTKEWFKKWTRFEEITGEYELDFSHDLLSGFMIEDYKLLAGKTVTIKSKIMYDTYSLEEYVSQIPSWVVETENEIKKEKLEGVREVQGR